MNNFDKKYLLIQFQNQIVQKTGSEFQSFFENIMKKAFPDFQKIRPYGNKGDGGNDGYRKEKGAYYQVYAPKEPSVHYANAAKKLKEDFNKLYESGWDEISNIKEYNFVFNDKYGGSIQELEKKISELQKANPNIEFNLFLAKKLEEIFLRLEESNIAALGFDLDKRQALEHASRFLEQIETELDQADVESAQKMLKSIKDFVEELDNEELSLKYEILAGQCLEKQEQVEVAKKRYQSLHTRFSKDTRPLIYLGNLFLNESNFDEHETLLQKAKEIDSDDWLVKIQSLIHSYYVGETIDSERLNEDEVPIDPKAQSDFYWVYGLIFEKHNDPVNADRFIEKAIHKNPDKFKNYLTKLSILESRMLLVQEESEKEQKAQELLEEIEDVEEKFAKIGSRNTALLYSTKFNVLRVLGKRSEVEQTANEIFEHLLRCYFDPQIDQVITMRMRLNFVDLSDEQLHKLLKYLKHSKKEISEELAKCLILQFNIKGTLLSEGKEFFEAINAQNSIAFIREIEAQNYNQILERLDNDLTFAFALALTSSDDGLRPKLINFFWEKEEVSEIYLIPLLDNEKVFEIVQREGIENLDYFRLYSVLSVVQQKQAWDFEVDILQRLLEKEDHDNEQQIFNLKVQLFNARYNLKQYEEVIEIGEKLLEIDAQKNFCNTSNKEICLRNTLLSCLERGKIKEGAYKKAEELLNKYQLSEPSFEFKVYVEAEVYLANNKPEQALKSITEGVKIKETLSLSPYEYGKLFLLFTEIKNRMDLNLNSFNTVTDNTFVKLKDTDYWYFIGEGEALDAVPISHQHEKYSLFAQKNVGDSIVFEHAYSSDKKEDTIEYIFSIEQYILWQVKYKSQGLVDRRDLPGITKIEVPHDGDSADLTYLQKCMEDLYKPGDSFFEKYLENNIPLAMLAVNEGGIEQAIGRIRSEQKGYINFSAGGEEFEQQKAIARKVLEQDLPFYIDGTSALFLSELGYLETVYSHISNVKVPQSVINLLGDINAKFTYTPGHVGRMALVSGEITLSSMDQETREKVQNNLTRSVEWLESKSDNIDNISLANKADCFSEKKIPSALSDPCILAQRNGVPVMTEDRLYLQMNELETSKDTPEYFSSLALLRVLYEYGQISFDSYLEYFGYLSSYRFRLLPLNTHDISKAVFGDDNAIQTIRPEKIRQLNFPLTLSKEYGVPFENAFQVVGGFVVNILRYDIVSLEDTERIFMEILDNFPTELDKKTLGEQFISISLQEMEKNPQVFSKGINTWKKVERLRQRIQRL